MKILVTGSAGFIGFHLTQKLLNQGNEVVGYDNINDYYDVNLKYDRLKETGICRQKISTGMLIRSNKFANYRFVLEHLQNNIFLNDLFSKEKFDVVVNLAAQVGVRYSLTHPQAYIDSNIQGFFNILEACRYNPVKHLVFASSSSVYGMNTKVPFSVYDPVDHPISLYAATKKSNELMAHTYSHLFNFPVTGLRFFTVYGPWGRPDMALFIFTKAILEGKPIPVFNYGDMSRDFTYVDDIVEGIIRVIGHPAKGNKDWGSDYTNPASSTAPYRIYNIGNSFPCKLTDFIGALEDGLGKKAKKDLMPMQPGDVQSTWAEVKELTDKLGYHPSTTVKEGVNNFIKWYKGYYKI